MKKSLIALCLLASLASVALAYPGPDSFGIYADNEAVGPVSTSAELAAFTQLPLYLCLTNPSGAEVLAWEAEVTNNGTPSTFIGTWALTAGLNVGADPVFIVGLGASPLSANAQGVVTLASMNAMILSPGLQVDFFIKGVEGSVSFPDGNPGYQAVLGIMTDGVTSTGAYTNPVFSINGTPPLSNEDRTWGSVKTLY